MTPPEAIKSALASVVTGKDLSQDEMAAVVGLFMDGHATGAQIGSLLTALRMKGETVDEVVGAALAMRSRMTRVECDLPVMVDTCGTGGDGSGSVNVSTLAAFVVAACGVPVAKHGNRALSSRSGSHDVIEALGINPAPSPELAHICLRDVGLAFLFAPTYHTATKAVAGARRELGFRTLFNLLGPLTNPAGARHHMNGVFAPERVTFLAEAHQKLGATRALVVHGHGGLDEIATEGKSLVAELRDGLVRTYEVSPADFELPEHDAKGLLGGLPDENARLLLAAIGGEAGAYRSAAVMSAAAAVFVAGKAPSLSAAARLCEQAIDSGKAMQILQRLRQIAPCVPPA
ncbi:MAG: anthranilate phosphoribosyltransferase [Deltaproteobacteria bacterium]|nr:anthranilate phosphoribosyltransferase [Deltaproteobacteria bacterium]